MKDALPKSMSLEKLIRRLSEGRFEIPDFQREFRWEPSDTRDLLNSIFQDYYIGNLLLWKGTKDTFDDLSCEPLSGYSGERGDREHIVLDGQQRLSSMFYAFFAPDKPAPNKEKRAFYFVRIDEFNEKNYEEAFEYRFANEQSFTSLNEQYNTHRFPLSILGEDSDSRHEWFQGYRKFWEDKARIADESGDTVSANSFLQNSIAGNSFHTHIKDLMREYDISYIELDQSMDIDKVCDIFTRINDTGTALNIFDLLNALLKPKGIRLRDLWNEAKPRLQFRGSRNRRMDRMNIYVLQVMSILQEDGYCSPKYLRRLVPRTIENDFKERWNEAVGSIERSIQLLSNPQEKYGAISARFLPYRAMIPAFSALQMIASRQDSSSQLTAFTKVRHWYWASVFTEAYSRAVGSTTARDFRNIRAWIESDEEPDVISEFSSSFPNLDLKGIVQENSAIYRGVFNLLILNGARDWVSGSAPDPSDIDDHHIVPQNWGKEHGADLTTSIDTILNRTPLSSETNRGHINDRHPNQYLPELIRQNGEGPVRAIFESHLIFRDAFDILLSDPFTPADFSRFIAERERAIRSRIESLLIKGRLDLEENLRKLDEDVERIELALRACVDEALGGSIDEIKGLHFFPKVQERIDSALRNPARDREHYERLTGKLEYFDLRELEETFKNKALWDRFAARFGSKEELGDRFGKLAELRNAIRHSRTADEITRKDGEAAILWFQAALELEN